MPPPERVTALSPLHRLWRALPAERRRRLLAWGTNALAPRPDRDPVPARGGVAIVGEIARASGLGEGARLMQRALDRAGIATWMIDARVGVPGEQSDLPMPGPAALPPGVPLVMHVNAPLMPLAALRLGRAAIRGRKIVGYWAWELPALPVPWRVGRSHAHEIWAPSRFTADAIRSAFAGATVRVVPHPVASVATTPGGKGREAFGLPVGAVVVLCSFNLASSFERKNPLAAVAAFRHAFDDRPDRLLVLKVGNIAHYADDLARLVAAVRPHGNIRIETGGLSPADNAALIACVDIVLTLHRSEGFGLVPAEAMVLGKPVVATGWSGNMDYMTSDTAALVDFRLVPAIDPRGTYAVDGAIWAEPDIEHAAAHLRHLAGDSAARIALGERARQSVRQSLGSEALLQAVAHLGLPPQRSLETSVARA